MNWDTWFTAQAQRRRGIRWLLCLVLLLAGCASGNQGNPSASDAPFIAPDVALRTLDNQMVRLSDLRGRWVLLNFWATWCAPCVEELPALEALAARYANTFTILTINMREDPAAVQAFMTEHNLHLPVLLDPDDQTLLAYQVQGLPLSILVSPSGELVQRMAGPVDTGEVERVIDT